MNDEKNHKKVVSAVLFQTLALDERTPTSRKSLRNIKTWCRKSKEVKNIKEWSATIKNIFTKNQLTKNKKLKNVKSNSVGSGGQYNLFQVGKAREDTKETFWSSQHEKWWWKGGESSAWVDEIIWQKISSCPLDKTEWKSWWKRLKR